MIFTKTEQRILFITIIGTGLYTWLLTTMGMLDFEEGTTTEPSAIDEGEPITITVVEDNLLLGDLVFTLPDIISTAGGYLRSVVSFPADFISAWLQISNNVNLWGFEWLLVLPAILLIVVLAGIAVKIVYIIWIG